MKKNSNINKTKQIKKKTADYIFQVSYATLLLSHFLALSCVCDCVYML